MNSASGEALSSTYGSVPVTASSSSGSTHVSAAADHQPVHPLPSPVDTSGLVRAIPDDVEDPDLGAARQQKLRFSDDWYTPEWVRGESAKKEGFCDLCQPGKWLQLKNSAFWYHRQYTHGISSVSGQPFANPVSFRPAGNEGSTEALCHQCNEWVMYTSRKQNAAEDSAARIPTNWFKVCLG
ncbi:hypothetical protein P389DRAFT_147429 [Cystobasidium minutum MCA 4210]|uniref:uncharacterized protein n=1 Tax=Cystobasidium minutum MCA 4210 TaxID=1397322 RepID=UPI0034CEEC87|eukprot:jgi/Rhomi1/147429/e_gw1.8.316.1